MLNGTPVLDIKDILWLFFTIFFNFYYPFFQNNSFNLFSYGNID
jgi:hypothetical protein